VAQEVPELHVLAVPYKQSHGFFFVNETNFVHVLFLEYFVNFIYNLYMFRTSPGPSSAGTTVFMQHSVFRYAI